MVDASLIEARKAVTLEHSGQMDDDVVVIALDGKPIGSVQRGCFDTDAGFRYRVWEAADLVAQAVARRTD